VGLTAAVRIPRLTKSGRWRFWAILVFVASLWGFLVLVTDNTQCFFGGGSSP
jgi:hypothetical protein